MTLSLKYILYNVGNSNKFAEYYNKIKGLMLFIVDNMTMKYF